MNFRLNSILFFLGLFLIVSCNKEPLDSTNTTGGDDPTPTVVMCDLEVAITNGTFSLTAALTGGTAPFTYAWSTGDDTDVISIAADGDYSLTVTDADDCEVSETISAVADPCNGFEGKISVTRDSTGVTLTAVTIGGTAPFVYEWDTGETTQSITNTTGGRQIALITDANGCGIAMEIDLGGGSDPCDGFLARIFKDSTGYVLTVEVFDGTPPYSYTWSNGLTDKTITVNADGTYDVLVTDANGCGVHAVIVVDGSTTIPCSNSTLDLTFGFDQTNNILSAIPIDGVPPYAARWDTGQTTLDISVTAGTYTVYVEDAEGCVVIGQYIVR